MITNSIIIPYRDRPDDLEYFIQNSIPKFGSSFEFLIIEQSKNKLFNRGALLNIGYLNMSETSEYFISHDVDLNPLEHTVEYYLPETENILGIYNNGYTLGGVIKVPVKIYEILNGFPNDYYGWGVEDKDFLNRAEYYKVPYTYTLINTKINTEDYYLRFDRYKREQNTGFNTKHNFAYNNWDSFCDKDRYIQNNGLSNIEYKVYDIVQVSDRVKKIIVDL